MGGESGYLANSNVSMNPTSPKGSRYTPVTQFVRHGQVSMNPTILADNW